MGGGPHPESVHSMETVPVPSYTHAPTANQQHEPHQLRMGNGATIFDGNVATAENHFPQVEGNLRSI